MESCRFQFRHPYVQRRTVCNRQPFFLPAQRSKRGRLYATYGDEAGWVAVCESRYCIKTTKPILKLFRPSVMVASSKKHSGPIVQIPNSTGNPFIGAFNTRGWENWRFLAIFCLSRKLQDRPMVTVER